MVGFAPEICRFISVQVSQPLCYIKDKKRQGELNDRVTVSSIHRREVASQETLRKDPWRRLIAPSNTTVLRCEDLVQKRFIRPVSVNT